MASPSASPMPILELHSLVNENNHGPAVTIAAALCMSVMLMFFFVRLWIRYPFESLFKADDFIACLSSMLATAQSTLILVAVHEGFGRKTKDLPPGRPADILKMAYSSDLLYVLALFLGKLSISLLCVRIAGDGMHTLGAKVLTYITIAWGLCSFLLISLLQDVSKPWAVHSYYGYSTLVRWAIVESMGLAVEAFTIIFIVHLVWGLQMSRRSKISIVMGILFRLPLFAIAPLRLYSIAHVAHSGRYDASFSAWLPECFTQLEMSFNIIAATVPCLRIFLRSFNSGYLGNIGFQTTHSKRSATNKATKGSEQDSSLRIDVKTTIELSNMEGKLKNPFRGSRGIDYDAASDRSEIALNSTLQEYSAVVSSE